MLRLRRPGSDDDSIWQLIVQELIPRSNNEWDAKEIKDELPQRLKRGITYVYTDGLNRIYGFIHAVFNNSKLIIDMLAVTEPMHGKGIGLMLLRATEQAALQKDCRSSLLLIDKGNDQAKRFYERNGYVRTRYIPSLKCYEMEKRLK
ncbi:GNAT family N-acetyltransferase [Paenibacillus taiwanensis]|uniref:GNAT family N-acetyltransferase n=1 Tax=Paenibacillus taiwanensis TaxID=401638 RepID=UPI0004239FCB|nr:GNAT family N-acetyltransferase [Paenibacillus taiwanensis]